MIQFPCSNCFLPAKIKNWLPSLALKKSLTVCQPLSIDTAKYSRLGLDKTKGVCRRCICCHPNHGHLHFNPTAHYCIMVKALQPQPKNANKNITLFYIIYFHLLDLGRIMLTNKLSTTVQNRVTIQTTKNREVIKSECCYLTLILFVRSTLKSYTLLPSLIISAYCPNAASKKNKKY